MLKVLGMGRLGRDPEARSTGGATPTEVSSFSMAFGKRAKKDGEREAFFINCTAFGKTAERINKTLYKGARIVAYGRLEVDEWTNRDGATVKTPMFYVDEFEYADAKKDAQQAAPAQGKTAKPAADFVSIPQGGDDVLPFSF